jgi:membrane protein
MPGIVERAKSQVEQLPAAASVKRVATKAQKDDVPDMAAGIAYHWIFAIPPLLILVIVLAATVESLTRVDVAARLQTEITERAPEDTAGVLNRLVDHAVSEVNGGLASLGVLLATALAIWSGSNGVAALVKAFNRIFDVHEERPALRKRLVSIGLTLLLVTILICAFLAMVYGRRLGEWTADEIGVGRSFEQATAIALWPLALAGIVMVLGILYWVGPNKDLPFNWLSPGAVVATVLWLLLTAGFGIYLRFANPGSAYGALGGVIVLMFFLYLTAMVILLGAEVNSVVLQEHRGADQEGDTDSRPESPT